MTDYIAITVGESDHPFFVPDISQDEWRAFIEAFKKIFFDPFYDVIGEDNKHFFVDDLFATLDVIVRGMAHRYLDKYNGKLEDGAKSSAITERRAHFFTKEDRETILGDFVVVLATHIDKSDATKNIFDAIDKETFFLKECIGVMKTLIVSRMYLYPHTSQPTYLPMSIDHDDILFVVEHGQITQKYVQPRAGANHSISTTDADKKENAFVTFIQETMENIEKLILKISPIKIFMDRMSEIKDAATQSADRLGIIDVPHRDRFINDISKLVEENKTRENVFARAIKGILTELEQKKASDLTKDYLIGAYHNHMKNIVKMKTDEEYGIVKNVHIAFAAAFLASTGNRQMTPQDCTMLFGDDRFSEILVALSNLSMEIKRYNDANRDKESAFHFVTRTNLRTGYIVPGVAEYQSSVFVTGFHRGIRREGAAPAKKGNKILQFPIIMFNVWNPIIKLPEQKKDKEFEDAFRKQKAIIGEQIEKSALGDALIMAMLRRYLVVKLDSESHAGALAAVTEYASFMYETFVEENILDQDRVGANYYPEEYTGFLEVIKANRLMLTSKCFPPHRRNISSVLYTIHNREFLFIVVGGATYIYKYYGEKGKWRWICEAKKKPAQKYSPYHAPLHTEHYSIIDEAIDVNEYRNGFAAIKERNVAIDVLHRYGRLCAEYTLMYCQNLTKETYQEAAPTPKKMLLVRALYKKAIACLPVVMELMKTRYVVSFNKALDTESDVDFISLVLPFAVCYVKEMTDTCTLLLTRSDIEIKNYQPFIDSKKYLGYDPLQITDRTIIKKDLSLPPGKDTKDSSIYIAPFLRLFLGAYYLDTFFLAQDRFHNQILSQSVIKSYEDDMAMCKTVATPTEPLAINCGIQQQLAAFTRGKLSGRIDAFVTDNPYDENPLRGAFQYTLFCLGCSYGIWDPQTLWLLNFHNRMGLFDSVLAEPPAVEDKDDDIDVDGHVDIDEGASEYSSDEEVHETPDTSAVAQPDAESPYMEAENDLGEYQIKFVVKRKTFTELVDSGRVAELIRTYLDYIATPNAANGDPALVETVFTNTDRTLTYENAIDFLRVIIKFAWDKLKKNHPGTEITAENTKKLGYTKDDNEFDTLREIATNAVYDGFTVTREPVPASQQNSDAESEEDKVGSGSESMDETDNVEQDRDMAQDEQEIPDDRNIKFNLWCTQTPEKKMEFTLVELKAIVRNFTHPSARKQPEKNPTLDTFQKDNNLDIGSMSRLRLFCTQRMYKYFIDKMPSHMQNAAGASKLRFIPDIEAAYRDFVRATQPVKEFELERIVDTQPRKHPRSEDDADDQAPESKRSRDADLLDAFKLYSDGNRVLWTILEDLQIIPTATKDMNVIMNVRAEMIEKARQNRLAVVTQSVLTYGEAKSIMGFIKEKPKTATQKNKAILVKYGIVNDDTSDDEVQRILVWLYNKSRTKRYEDSVKISD